MTAGRPSGRVEAAVEVLRANGERVTPARRAILEILDSSTEHLSADDLANHLSEASPSIHRATVYRTLDSLVNAGIVAHVHLPHGAATYHLRPGDSENAGHLHVLCRRCGVILDAAPDLLDTVAERLADSAGFRLDPDHVALSGLCRECFSD